jgi:predicted transcriptional regulator
MPLLKRQFAKAPDGQHDEAAAVVESLDLLPARVRSAAMLRGLGYSLREIGGLLGISAQAVSIMFVRHRHSMLQMDSASELRSLSSRAANALSRHGIRTRREAATKNVPTILDGERNCGAKTRREIARWMQDPQGPDNRNFLAPEPAAFRESEAPLHSVIFT